MLVIIPYDIIFDISMDKIIYLQRQNQWQQKLSIEIATFLSFSVKIKVQFLKMPSIEFILHIETQKLDETT